MLNERQFNVRVEYAHGHDWNAPRQSSEVSVLAQHEREAKLIAEQMAMIPQPGKHQHIQITHTEVQ